MQEQINNIEKLTKEIHRAIYIGDGLNNPALVTRLDRLEQAETRRVWLIRAAVGSAISAFIAAVYSLFGTKW